MPRERSRLLLPLPLARAVRRVRSRTGKWRIDPARIGIMGSPSGGHPASTPLTRWYGGAADPVERQGSRPDFGVLSAQP